MRSPNNQILFLLLLLLHAAVEGLRTPSIVTPLVGDLVAFWRKRRHLSTLRSVEIKEKKACKDYVIPQQIINGVFSAAKSNTATTAATVSTTTTTTTTTPAAGVTTKLATAAAAAVAHSARQSLSSSSSDETITTHLEAAVAAASTATLGAATHSFASITTSNAAAADAAAAAATTASSSLPSHLSATVTAAAAMAAAATKSRKSSAGGGTATVAAATFPSTRTKATSTTTTTSPREHAASAPTTTGTTQTVESPSTATTTTTTTNDLTGTWQLEVTESFKQEYDRYLAQLGQPCLVRRVAVAIVGRTKEETRQNKDDGSLYVKSTNPRGVWERQLPDTGKDGPGVSVRTIDNEPVTATSWWEEDVHCSWLRGVTMYGGGGAFESRRYLLREDDTTEFYICESTFHFDSGAEPARITWRFRRTTTTTE